MAQRQVAEIGTSAVVAPNQVAFSLRSKDFKYGKPIVSIEGLAGAETASFWYLTNGTWEELDDGAGTQVAYTATYAADIFNGPGTYGLTKDATAAAITVSVENGV